MLEQPSDHKQQLARQHDNSNALTSCHGPSPPSGVRNGSPVKEMLLSRRLRDRAIWKGAVTRLLPRLGFTHATVFMPTSLAMIIFFLSVANMYRPEHGLAFWIRLVCRSEGMYTKSQSSVGFVWKISLGSKTHQQHNLFIASLS